MVAPLVVIGTKEGDSFDLAPKHLAFPVGFGNYFGFVCTPDHGTYHNVKKYKEFTVSFPVPNQITTASLSASPRKKAISKSQGILQHLPLVQAKTLDAPMIKDAYLHLECALHNIIDGFDDNSIITGKITSAHVHRDFLKVSERDEAQQLKQHPLLAYIAEGRFATIADTYNFPFPKDFQR